MTKQITVRVPDDIAEWLSKAESKTDVVTAALREARRQETMQQIEAEYERRPETTPDDWGDPVEFSEANRKVIWSTDGSSHEG